MKYSQKYGMTWNKLNNLSICLQYVDFTMYSVYIDISGKFKKDVKLMYFKIFDIFNIGCSHVFLQFRGLVNFVSF